MGLDLFVNCIYQIHNNLYTKEQTMSLLLLISNVFASSYDMFSFNKRVEWIGVTTLKIVICDRSKVSKQRVVESIQFWDTFYPDYSGVQFEEQTCDIKTSFIDGTIVITNDMDFHTEDYYAMTFYKFHDNDSNKGIQAVRIEINPEYASNKKLLIHELGHAIGILHTSYDKTHVMHEHVVENEHVRVN